jgi:hypothetical protein
MYRRQPTRSMRQFHVVEFGQGFRIEMFSGARLPLVVKLGKILTRIWMQNRRCRSLRAPGSAAPEVASRVVNVAFGSSDPSLPLQPPRRLLSYQPPPPPPPLPQEAQLPATPSLPGHLGSPLRPPSPPGRGPPPGARARPRPHTAAGIWWMRRRHCRGFLLAAAAAAPSFMARRRRERLEL